MEGMNAGVAVCMGWKNSMFDGFLGLKSWLLLLAEAILFDWDNNIEEKMGSIVDDLQAECHKQVPELNCWQVETEDSSILKSSQEKR